MPAGTGSPRLSDQPRGADNRTDLAGRTAGTVFLLTQGDKLTVGDNICRVFSSVVNFGSSANTSGHNNQT